MKEFSQTTVEALKYYVYALIDPRDNKIFYVGKGRDNRVFNHIQCAVENTKNEKLEIINAIHSEGKRVDHYIIRHNLSEKEAFLVESVLINLLTYQDFKTIANIANIVAGHGEREYGIKNVSDIENYYCCEDLDIKNVQHKLISININKSYKGQQTDIYEATRKCWVLNPQNANEAEYVLSEYKGVVRAIFKVDKKGWQFCKDEKSNRRYLFEGKEVTDKEILDLYLNKRITKKKGETNPIKYIGY